MKKGELTKNDLAFAEALKYWSEKKNISKDKLVELSEKSKRTIDYVFSLQRGMGKNTAFALCEKMGTSYSDMLNLGQWILDGNKGDDWMKPIHGDMDLNTPKPAFGMEATATNRSTAVVGDGSAGRDVINITGETTNFQLTDLELKVIKLNREYGNKNLLKGFLRKLKELKKIVDNMF